MCCSYYTSHTGAAATYVKTKKTTKKILIKSKKQIHTLSKCRRILTMKAIKIYW
jgi:hypothetical protein